MKKLLLMMIVMASMVFAAVNINKASKEELMSLKGIGDKTAEAIIKFRAQHHFRTLDELMQVKGIGKKRFAQIQSEIEL